MKIKPFTKTNRFFGRSLAVTAVTVLLLVAVPVSAALAQVTTEIVPTANGFYTSWAGPGGYTRVDEGTAAANCNTNDVITSNVANARFSVSIPLTSVPDGSVITDVNVLANDRGDTAAGGTYATFVRLDGADSGNSATHTATGTVGGCTSSRNDGFDVADTTKGTGTTLEVGVIKLNTTSLRVGVLSAVVTYKFPTTLTVASATGTYGGTAVVSATLTRTSGGAAVGGKTVDFTLNGSSVGSAVTDASGVATLSTASLSGINANSYPSGVGASFATDADYMGSIGTGSLTVNKASQTITVGTHAPSSAV